MFIVKDNQIFKLSDVTGNFKLKLFDKYNISCECLIDYYLPKIRKEYPYDKIKFCC